MLPPAPHPIWEDSVHEIPMNDVSPDFAECSQAPPTAESGRDQLAEGTLSPSDAETPFRQTRQPFALRLSRFRGSFVLC